MRAKTLALLATVATALPATALAATEADYEKAYAEAVEVHERSLELQHGWTTTEQTLEAAEAAAARGEYEKAMELAEEAEGFAERAVEQARNQEDAWKQAVIR